MKFKSAKKVFSIILSLSLMLQIGLPALHAGESSLPMTREYMTLGVDGAVDGGNITTKGLDFSRTYKIPKVITQYKAGNGCVLVTPAKDSASGKLTLELNNAKITSNSGKALHLPGGEVELVITASNELAADFS